MVLYQIHLDFPQIAKLSNGRTSQNRVSSMAYEQVALSETLVEGQGIEVIWQGNVIAVFRHGGVLYAIDGICMHQGGPLARGKLCQGTIECPWHGWTYDLKTGNNTATCQPMLSSYRVREQAGKIEIDFGT